MTTPKPEIVKFPGYSCAACGVAVLVRTIDGVPKVTRGCAHSTAAVVADCEAHATGVGRTAA